MVSIKIAKLQADFFEELSDADLMAVVGGTGGTVGNLVTEVDDKGVDRLIDTADSVEKKLVDGFTVGLVRKTGL